MNPKPVAVEYLEDYKLIVTFTNGERKVFDARPLLHMPMYERIRNKGFFSLAKADGMCVFWNDDIDICPDMLYEDSIKHEV